MEQMKGQKEYIEKYGRHFTVELAYRAAGRHKDAKEIYDYLQKKVYYNVSGMTLGDIVYLFNGMSSSFEYHDKETRDFVLWAVQDYNDPEVNNLFDCWTLVNGGFDFTPYI